jgi:hypothetical protein
VRAVVLRCGAPPPRAPLSAFACARRQWRRSQPSWCLAGKASSPLPTCTLPAPPPPAPLPAAPRDFSGSEPSAGGGGGGEPFLAVGSAEAFGEDYPALGRVLLFQVGGHKAPGCVASALEGFFGGRGRGGAVQAGLPSARQSRRRALMRASWGTRSLLSRAGAPAGAQATRRCGLDGWRRGARPRAPPRLRTTPLPPDTQASAATHAHARTPQITRDTLFRIEGGSEETVSCRLALWRELTGPVTAVDALRGYLVVAVGPRVEMHYKQVGWGRGQRGAAAGAGSEGRRFGPRRCHRGVRLVGVGAEKAASRDNGGEAAQDGAGEKEATNESSCWGRAPARSASAKQPPPPVRPPRPVCAPRRPPPAPPHHHHHHPHPPEPPSDTLQRTQSIDGLSKNVKNASQHPPSPTPPPHRAAPSSRQPSLMRPSYSPAASPCSRTSCSSATRSAPCCSCASSEAATGATGRHGPACSPRYHPSA